LIHEKINECEKVYYYLLNMKFCFFKWFFLLCFFELGHVNAFYLYDTSKATTNYIMA
jgi:hypothetical protein